MEIVNNDKDDMQVTQENNEVEYLSDSKDNILSDNNENGTTVDETEEANCMVYNEVARTDDSESDNVSVILDTKEKAEETRLKTFPWHGFNKESLLNIFEEGSKKISEKELCDKRK